jgi:selenide,water dikinase
VRRLHNKTSPELLVGAATGDDAAVWRLDDDRALVSTADFITPVVDDPRAWGLIAVANSVSDVYAMGGRPLFGLNLVCWNSDALGADLLAEVLAGGDEMADRAGFPIVGGHTVDDPEPKYGLAVTGQVHPDRILTNSALRAGQDLVLTKPLGVGVITTAIKAGRAGDLAVDAAVESMSRLNDVASRVALDAGATGCTDVTGYGLLGHLGQMLAESGVDAEIFPVEVPVLPEAAALAAEGMIPGGTRRNLAWIGERVDPGDHDESTVLLMADAQTSGGLVFGVDPGRSDDVVAELAETGHTAAVIGRTHAGDGALRLR